MRASWSPIYPCNIAQGQKEIPTLSAHGDSWKKPLIKAAKPRVLIPVFPGTNCEYDAAKAMAAAGAEPEIVVIKNLTAGAIAQSMEHVAQRLAQAQIVFLPGGFSGGDEPDGSAKLITSFFRSGQVKEQVNELLKNRDGLMLGVCNGFQALIKLGLVPYGEIVDTDETCPTLTFNTIGRHQSRLVRTRVASNQSPWLMKTQPGRFIPFPSPTERGASWLRRNWCGSWRSGGRLPPSMWTWRAIPPRIFTTIPTTLSGPLRESPPPTVVCSARWATVSGRARACTATSPVTMT